MRNILQRGSVQVATLAGILGLIASVGVPFLWVGNVKGDIEKVNLSQGKDIEQLQRDRDETKGDIRELKKGMTALLIANGINPEKLK